MTIQRFEDVIAWQKARELTLAIYGITRSQAFAKDFGLTDQIRRAAVSIGSNIAEGFDRGSTKEFLTFLGFAKGSSAEVRSQLYTAYDVCYISKEELDRLTTLALEVSKIISGFMVKLRGSGIKGVRHRVGAE